MKIVRWLAAAVLTLVSLMNVGLAFGDNGAGPALRVIGPVLGGLGFVAVYGLLRRRRWGTPAALAMCAVNVLAAFIALLAGSPVSPAAGLVVSLVALVLTAVAAYGGRTGSARPEPQPTNLAS